MQLGNSSFIFRKSVGEHGFEELTYEIALVTLEEYDENSIKKSSFKIITLYYCINCRLFCLNKLYGSSLQNP